MASIPKRSPVITSDKARILIISNSYLPVVGGVQTVTHNLARELIASGYEVRVVTNRYPVALPARETVDGVTVDRLLFLTPDIDYLRRRRPDLFGASFLFGPQTYAKLRTIMRDFRPDVINVHFPDHQTPFVLKLRREFDFRLVVSLHGHDIEGLLAGSTNGASRNSNHSKRSVKRLKSILREAEAVTACSRDLLNKATEIESSVCGKGEVIYNGVDQKRFLDKTSYSHPRPYILALGRLTYRKGFDMLLEAFAQHEATQSKPDLIIAGDGEEHDTLLAKVEQLGLTRSVHFVGNTTSQEVVRLLKSSVSVVVPSRSEAFGIVALEAVAAGKPVLATKTGGLGEFLFELNNAEAKNGARAINQAHRGPCILLVEPTVEGLARGLREIFQLPRNGIAAVNGYSLPDKYTWAHAARRYENVFSVVGQ